MGEQHFNFLAQASRGAAAGDKRLPVDGVAQPALSAWVRPTAQGALAAAVSALVQKLQAIPSRFKGFSHDWAIAP